MKVLIVNNAVPFIWGGAEELAANLNRQLNARNGIEAEILRIPFQWEPKERLATEILMNQTFDIVNVDKVIALKFPAYHVQHENKTLWLLHQFRQAYDLCDAKESYLVRGEDDDLINMITKSDTDCFNSARKIYINSPVTQKRLFQYNKIKSEVLYPPLNDEALFVPGERGDYIFAGGRVDKGKRQHLLIEAAHKAGENCKLIVAGPPASAEYAQELEQMVEELGIGHRVKLHLRMHSREELADYATNALAAAYIPFDEDSLGYVTMEAMASGKAVVTTSDSGGLLEIVKNGETGFVTSPNAAAIGEAFAKLSDNHSLAEKYGDAALKLWSDKQITWEHTLDKLLS